MNAQGMIRENATRVADVARAAGVTAGALVEILEKKSELLAEAIEKQSDLVVAALGSKTAPVAKLVEEKAAPLAKAVEVKADVLGDALEVKLEKARRDALDSLKEFKFGRREALLLGFAVGVFAVAVISRRIDKRAAADRLRAAGARVGESAQGLGSKVSPAVASLTGKAGELAGQVKEGVSTAASGLAGQLRPTNGHLSPTAGEQPDEIMLAAMPPPEEGRQADVEEARQRLAAGEPESAAPDAKDAPQAGAPEAESSEEPQAAGEPRELAGDQSGAIAVSTGMKVVAFDGTDIGRVQETREDDFVLDRPRGADLLVPLDQVARVEGTVVYLRVETGQVPKMGWEKA